MTLLWKISSNPALCLLSSNSPIVDPSKIEDWLPIRVAWVTLRSWCYSSCGWRCDVWPPLLGTHLCSPPFLLPVWALTSWGPKDGVLQLELFCILGPRPCNPSSTGISSHKTCLDFISNATSKQPQINNAVRLRDYANLFLPLRYCHHGNNSWHHLSEHILSAGSCVRCLHRSHLIFTTPLGSKDCSLAPILLLGKQVPRGWVICPKSWGQRAAKPEFKLLTSHTFHTLTL